MATCKRQQKVRLHDFGPTKDGLLEKRSHQSGVVNRFTGLTFPLPETFIRNKCVMTFCCVPVALYG